MENRDTIRSFLDKIPQHIRWCFCTGVISGILIHAYMLTNKFPNWDDINNIRGYAVGSEFGRWFLKNVHPLTSDWSVPWLTGLFVIVMVSAAACMVISALDLKSLTSAVLIPLIMMAFPSMCSLFTFMFTADCYSVGILLACTAVWLIRKFRYGFIPGMILLILSMGIYQSYLCFALGLLVCGLFFDMQEKMDAKSVFLKGVFTVAVLGISVFAYVKVSRMIFPPMSEYNGVGNMGQLELTRLPRLILRAYRYVAEYFVLKPYSFVSTASYVLNLLCCLAAAAGVIWFFVRKKMWNRPLNALLYLFLAAAVPLAMGSIIIMAPDAAVSMLMLYQYCILHVFVVAMLEKRGKEMKFGKVTGFGVTILILLVVYQNFVVTNEAYFRMGIGYERASAWYNRIMVRLEATEGYRYGDAFVLVGEYGLTDTPSILGTFKMDADRFNDLSGAAKEDGMLTSGVRHNFMKTYIGVEMPDVSEETLGKIRESEEYKEMPSFPDDGCVKKIEGVWVVKTCEEIR